MTPHATPHDTLAALRTRYTGELAVADAATPGPWCWSSVSEQDPMWSLGVACDPDGNPLSGELNRNSDKWAVAELVCESDYHPDNAAFIAAARNIAAALNELPAQIARWLARLDEADRLNAEAIRSREVGAYGMAGDERKEAGTLLATVTEDVQAWEAQIERLGVAVGAVKEGTE